MAAPRALDTDVVDLADPKLVAYAMWARPGR
jgi:hypothetical protein